MDELTEQQAAILAFERQWWQYAGAKETAVLERFGLNYSRYYQIVNALIDMPAAEAADPMTVRRLRRLRDARRAARTQSTTSPSTTFA